MPFFTAERMTEAPLTGRAAMISASSDAGSVSVRQNRMSVSKEMIVRRRRRGTFSSTARAARCAFCSSASMLPLVSRSTATSRETPSSAPRAKTEIGPRPPVLAHLEGGLGQVGHHLPRRIRDGDGHVDEVELRLEDHRRRRLPWRVRGPGRGGEEPDRDRPRPSLHDGLIEEAAYSIANRGPARSRRRLRPPYPCSPSTRSASTLRMAPLRAAKRTMRRAKPGA